MAAGKGKRLKSQTPKVLHPVCGRPVLWHVLKAAQSTKPTRIVVVVATDKELVEAEVSGWGIKPAPVLVDQGIAKGTGHAVMVAEHAVSKAEDVLVIPGDNPLVEPQMLKAVLAKHRRSKSAATMLTTLLDNPRGYGRIVRDGDEFVKIAEEKDATPEERAIREIATAVFAFRRPALYAALPLVGTDNVQHEYYLPDVLGILRDKGEPVSVVDADFGGALDINTRNTLSRVAAVMRRRINAAHMANGVTLVDPEQTYIDVGVRIGEDTVLYPQTFLYGETKVGTGCAVGPATAVSDSVIGHGTRIEFSVVRNAKIGRGVAVGPYTHIRPGTVLADGSKTGSFVEIKGSTVGEGSKVPHLAYVGDATLGKNVNIGAGTVTVNYDGYDKHPTRIGDDARIGSDTMLVAPVKVGKGAVTGAGSVISKDVAAGSLAVERAEQREIKGYRKRKDAEKGKDKSGKRKKKG